MRARTAVLRPVGPRAGDRARLRFETDVLKWMAHEAVEGQYPGAVRVELQAVNSTYSRRTNGGSVFLRRLRQIALKGGGYPDAAMADTSPAFISLPPPWLDPDDLPALNERFYRAEPHDYFSTRLDLLILAAGKLDLIFDAFREGVEYRGLRVGGPGAVKLDEETLERQHLAFVVAESVTLLHHASETLLRFFFAHSPDEDGKVTPCPWLEIAAELSHARFKEKVSRRFDGAPLTEARRAEVSTTFYGSASPPTSTPEQAARLAASVENIEQWLQYFAAWFLGEAHLFNSLKHGLAVQPGKATVRLFTPLDDERAADPPLIHANGPAVSFLEKSGPLRLWHETTRWIEPERVMIEARHAVWLMKSIWQVGRTRYTSLSKEGEMLRFYDQPSFADYMNTQLGGENWRIITNRASMNLGYLYAYPPELSCTRCGRSPRPEEKETAHREWRVSRDGGSSLLVYCPECVAALAQRAAGEASPS